MQPWVLVGTLWSQEECTTLQIRCFPILTPARYSLGPAWSLHCIVAIAEAAMYQILWRLGSNIEVGLLENMLLPQAKPTIRDPDLELRAIILFGLPNIQTQSRCTFRLTCIGMADEAGKFVKRRRGNRSQFYLEKRTRLWTSLGLMYAAQLLPLLPDAKHGVSSPQFIGKS